ncbi:uncharacterized protein LOC111455003 isoform X2 [Cucurbita moschata]|uniref:Uncharacterized protein LOC111455003 isoform X2 n=1 Tax=Cucurbita moschata TaxID=3662 RepID=A0A6J1GLB0_CUCMO|nr:uncharacterized protein LOC111455003 isoform X2 [Cucurbita moschata]
MPFSIREYALNMRGTDLKRSWPFSENVKKEVAQALLPPMDVRKFRWWSHQQTDCGGVVEEKEVVVVDRIQMQKICPVCGVFVAATVNAMNAHIDSCLAQTTKERPRNKGGGGGGGGAKSRTPKKRSIAEIFAVAPPVKTMIIGNDCEEGEKGIGKQMIRDKLKATSLARSLVSAMKTIKAKNTRNEEEMRRRRRRRRKKKKKKNKNLGDEQLCKKGERNHKDVSARCCKKPCFKRLSRPKRKKLVKKSNVVGRQQRPLAPLRSILKHSVKEISETRGSNQASNNGGQKYGKRVSFWDKDDVLGPTTGALSDTFEQNGCNPFQASEGSTKSGESDKGVASMEVGVEDDVVSVSPRHDIDSQSWDNAKHSTEKLISTNRVIPRDQNDLHLFDHVYVDAPQKLPPVASATPALLAAAQEERQYGHVRTQCRAHSLYGSNTSRVPSSSLSENAGGRFLNLAQSSDKDARCSFPNWEQSAVAHKEKGVNDGFFCLPLNSKGELIQLNSGLVNRFDQMNEANNTMACSSRIPVCSLVLPRRTRDYFIDNEKLLVDTELTRNQLTLFPLHSNVQENQNQYLSARFDVTEPGTSERGTESGRFLHSNLMESPFYRSRYYGSTEINPESSSSVCANPARQTMRLMGKDVAVGEHGKEVQEPEVINFWKNSTLIDNCLTNPIQENPMRKRNFLQDRELHHPSKGEALFYHPAAFHHPSNAPQVRYPHLHLNRTYQRPDSVINLNERFNNNVHVSTDVFNNTAPNFQAPFISGPETLRFGSQPSAFSTSYHMYPNRYESCFEFGFDRKLRPEKPGTFNFPFLQPDDHGNAIQVPWFHSSKSLPPWMLHDHQREAAPTTNGYYYPFISSATDVLISPSSMHHRLEAAYPCSTMPYFQPMPVAPRVLQSPSIANPGHETRMSFEDRLKFNTLSVKQPELVNSRKRQKMSNLETNNTREFSDDQLRYNPATAKIPANWEKAVNLTGNISNVAQTDGVPARSGPIKLTAGAKHILKPSQRRNLAHLCNQ